MLKKATAVELTVKEMRALIYDFLEQNQTAKAAIDKIRRDIIAVQLGLSQKGLLISGQCAPDAQSLEDGRYPAFEVPHALHENAQQYNESLVHIPRVCWKKPRSSTGPAGLYHEPSGASFALREIYLPLIQAGIPFAYELLDSDDPLQNAASYIWLGARSVGHNSLWYSLSAHATCPIGIKNSETGRFNKIDNAATTIRSQTQIRAALHSANEATITTAGNQFVNAIYRGGELQRLQLQDPLEIKTAFQEAFKDFCRTAYKHHLRALLDISHGNARLFTKGARDEQGQLAAFDAFEELIQQNPAVVTAGEFGAQRDITVKDVTMGVMAEVNWLPGRNDPNAPQVPGRSNVDACLGLGQGIDLQKRIATLYSHDPALPHEPLWADHPAFGLQ
jgi:phospho-2-dehydro-3-deoxyheptonate aldolase